MNQKSEAPQGLGRLQSTDWRDLEHILEPRRVAEYKTKIWRASNPYDQKETSSCVGHAWLHFLIGSPDYWPKANRSKLPDPYTIYDEAQKVDEWSGPPPPYDGTSVRAGAKVLRSMGLIGEYRWAMDTYAAINHIMTRGPLVLGTDWYSGMTSPDRFNYARPEGWYQGGHAYLAHGYSVERRAFRCLNSWGLEWGDKGHFWLHFNDFDRLLHARGEVCSAVEIRT